ncbi:unnamed protein product [Brugia timori]|uniref:Uncharacterized protein n=2 Tax=Onchocercidae TaxID=6296 RepID=A0A0R3R1Y3_9BILA|nr:unnamed protein product [Brugia timori]
MHLYSDIRHLPSLLVLLLCVAITTVIIQGNTVGQNKKFEGAHITMDNCKSEKLRELVLETIGLFPHQYSYQARYMKEQAEIRFGNWWSAVIIGDRGGYGMSAVYDQYANTRYVR